MQQRKQEVPLAETERQRAAYLALVRGFDNGRVVDATQAPEKVGADISRAILDFMAERTRGVGAFCTNDAPSTEFLGRVVQCAC